MKNFAAAPFYFFMAMMLMLMACSCSTVHKVLDKQKIKVDSVRTEKHDSIVQKHIDTTKIISSEKIQGSAIEVDLDTSGPVQKDYTITYDRNTETIHSSQPIKKAKFQTDSDIKYSNFTGGIDSSFLEVKDTASVHATKAIAIVHQTVDRKGMSLGFKIGIIAAIVIAIALFIFIAWLKKKKKTAGDLIKDII
jgi:hypothetical protein